MTDDRVHTPSSPEFHNLVREYEKDIIMQEFDVRNTSGDPQADLLDQLHRELQSIFSDFRPLDWVKVSFIAGTMTSPASTRFDHYMNLRLEDITDYIVTMDQSQKLDMKTDKITVSVSYIHHPEGTGSSDNRSCELVSYLSKLRCLVDMRVDNNCFARAVTYLIFKHEYGSLAESKDALKSFVSHLRPHQRVLLNPARKEAHDVLTSLFTSFMHECGLTDGQAVTSEDYDRIAAVLATPNGHRRQEYRLVVALPNRKTVFKGRHKTSNTIDILYSQAGHYFALTKPTAFFRNAVDPRDRLTDFCSACDLNVDRMKHACESTCSHCKQMDMDIVCQVEEAEVTCMDCKDSFPNPQCMQQHITNKACIHKAKCEACGKVYRPGSGKHVCYRTTCFICGEKYAKYLHECYIKGLNEEKLVKKDKQPTVYCFFDTETAQVPRTMPDGSTREKHVPVMVCVQVVCNLCWKDTESYGEWKAQNAGQVNCDYCGRHKRIFENDEVDCMDQLVRFLHNDLMAQHIDKRLAPKQILVVAHNMKRFDGMLLFEALSKSGFAPTHILTNGLSIMSATIGPNMRLIDSINFLLQPLSQLPKSYMLPVTKKMFPHFATLRACEGWTGEWPTLEDFYHSRLLPDQKKELEDWYEQQDRSCAYDFWGIMRSYITDDVKVLMLAFMKFREEFKAMMGTDPYTRNITLAGAVTEGLRVTQNNPSGHLSIPINPYHSYDAGKKVSIKSRIWLLWWKEKFYPELKFEFKDIETGLKFDGYDAATNTIFEFYGCLFHMCDVCYGPGVLKEAVALNSKLDFNELRLSHKRREAKLDRIVKERSAKLIVIYEHTYDEMVRMDMEMKEYHGDLVHGVRRALNAKDTNIREALFGGRVEALILLAIAGKGRIMYKDFVSLYPAMQVWKRFPASHPVFIYKDFCQDVGLYFGLVLCSVIPPKQARFGALPYRSEGRLCFPLCKKCTEENNERSCNHCDKDRMLTGLWTSMEVKNALENGYTMSQIYLVMHHEKHVEGVLNPVSMYLRLLLKNKIRYSGRGSMNDEELGKFLEELHDMYDIDLKPEEISDNPGARQVAKLSMNGIWGRMSINTDRPNTAIVATYSDLLELMMDQTIVVKDVFMVGEVIKVLYEGKKAFIKTPAYSSLMTSVMTTSWARLELYEKMKLLGDRVLYVDTDGIFYKLEEGEEDPIPTGQHLGEMSDETEKWGAGARIDEFVSGGAKSYAVKLTMGDGSNKYIVKHKGIRANSDTYAKLSFETMKAAIRKRCTNTSQRAELIDMKKVVESRLEHCKNEETANLLTMINEALSSIDEKITVDQFLIRPNNYFELESIIMKKDWRVNYDKRRLLPGGASVPRGYVDDATPDVDPETLREWPPSTMWDTDGLKYDRNNWHNFKWEELEPGKVMSYRTLLLLLNLVNRRNIQYGHPMRSMGTKMAGLNCHWESAFKHDLIFVPYRKPFNWSLLVMDRKQMTIKYYDPVISHSHVMNDLHKMANKCWDRMTDPESPIGHRYMPVNNGWDSLYAVSTVADLHRMTRSGDSGLFVVLYADLLSMGGDPRTVTPEMVEAYRAKLAMQREEVAQGYFSFEPPGKRYTVKLPD